MKELMKQALIKCSVKFNQNGIYENAGFTYLQKDKEYHQYYKAIN